MLDHCSYYGHKSFRELFQAIRLLLETIFLYNLGLTVTFIEFSVRHAWVVPPLATFNISITEPFSRSV